MSLEGALAAEFNAYRLDPYRRSTIRPSAQVQADPPPALSAGSLAVIGVLAISVVAIFAATVSMDLKPQRRSRTSLR